MFGFLQFRPSVVAECFRLTDLICFFVGYLKRKLLKFFSTNNQTEDIFVFLRLVAAIWLCSHRADYEEVIPGLEKMTVWQIGAYSTLLHSA